MRDKEAQSSEKKSSSKINFSLKTENTTYDFTLVNKDGELSLKFQDLNEFPVKIFELQIAFEKLKELDDNFFMFKRVERFIDTIKKCIELEKFSLLYNKDENVVIFEIKNELFENGGAKIKIPEQKQNVESKVEALTKTISEMRKEIQNLKIKQLEKDEAALKTFNGTSFLKDEEKKMISYWINPNKVIRFNMLFNSNNDGDSCSTFHYYCDGVFPTVTVVLDTSGRRFGGYSTSSWNQSTVGACQRRAPESFIFDLSNKQKYELKNQFDTSAIYPHNSYGPVFGSAYDLYLANSCTQNSSSYCSKGSYNTGDNNLIGENGQTNFQVSYYEVYQVIFE